MLQVSFSPIVNIHCNEWVHQIIHVSSFHITQKLMCPWGHCRICSVVLCESVLNGSARNKLAQRVWKFSKSSCTVLSELTLLIPGQSLAHMTVSACGAAFTQLAERCITASIDEFRRQIFGGMGGMGSSLLL